MNSTHIKYLFLSAIIISALPLRAIDESQTRVAILYSSYTAKLNEGFIPKASDQITLWEIFLMQNKIAYSVIYDKDLERGISDDFDILILPSVYAISEKEFNSLKNFLEDGNSILNMGSKLSYDSDQNYEGLDYLNELFGIYFSEYTGKDLSLFQYLDQDFSFWDNNFKNPALQISTKYPPIICNTESKFLNRIGYIKNANEASAQTLLIYGKASNGKFVNVGFNFDDVIGGMNEQEIFSSFILNSIKWLDKTPDVHIKNFPDEFTTASIALLENSNALRPELIDKLDINEIRPYLLFTPGQKLSDEIKIKINDGHFIIDFRNLITDSSGVNLNLPDIISEKENQLNQKIKTVFLSDQMISNKALITSLNERGINIFLFDQYSPGLPELTDNKKFLIPYYENNSGKTVDNQINYFTYKAKINCDENVETKFVDAVLKSKSYKNWFCTFDQLRDWYELKDNLTVSVSDVIENKFSITISNNNNDKIDGVNLLINLPSDVNPDLLEVNSGSELINYSIDGLNQLNLIVNELGPKQFRKINISFYVK